MTLRFPLLAAALAAALAPGLRADELPIVAKARAYLGSEAVLDSVRSVHFVGKIDSVDPSDPKRTITATVDIIFQKPWQHRIIMTTPTIIRTIGLDDYDVWQELQDAKNPANAREETLTLDMIKSLRADVWENLGFYRGLEDLGGSIEDQGPATIDGVACEKVAFIHSPQIIFYRYFEKATGRLVYTETASGFQIHQSGEKIVDGIRFPLELNTTHKNASGQPETTVYRFETIEVNRVFPDSDFEMPPPTPPVMPTPKPAAPPAPAVKAAAPAPPPASNP